MAIISQQLHDNYATSPWSQFARALRIANNDTSGANYATFWYQLAFGGPVFQQTNSSGQYHSEKMAWLAINGNAHLNTILVPNWAVGQAVGAHQNADAAAIAGSRVLVVYTEREPCGACTPMLENVLPNATYVLWHFQYASEETSKYKHDKESIAIFGLDQLKYGGSYDASREKDTRKASRKAGNAQHSAAMKGRGTVWAGGPPPVTLNASAAPAA